MSQQETHRGRLLHFERLTDEKDKDYLIRFCAKIDEEFQEESWEGSIQEYIYEADLYEQMFYVNDKIYQNSEHQEYEDYDFHEFSGNDIDGYTYFTSFYNGGTCLAEIIEDELKERQ